MASTGAEKWLGAWRHIGLLASAGWDGDIKDVDLVATEGPKAHLYVIDLQTEWVWMASASKAGFDSVSAGGKGAVEPEREEVRSALGVLAVRLAEKRATTTREMEERLAILASMYAGATKIYSAHRGFPGGCHFVILVYRKPGSEVVMLRPFAMAHPPEAPVSAAELMGAVAQVVQLDRVRHPEWLEGKVSKDE